ncbi:hypothetical protein DN730_08095 [Marinomonas piezotolerans]|uniref:Terminase large subunit gp17-like C-terminal domain-containing protein n=1 Tax=Marinomonas piezotolerans TaxID=2213058 RepID=A0A370U9B1_9GAMM|nr:hypothetical protein [Marinomonas piezotolerans]RDL44355.1 hypothetical protein DN730_08095 [Marinomonas piezotolerans]
MDRAERRRRIKALRKDYATFAKRCLKIKVKAGEIKAFEFNAAQEHIHNEIEDQLKRIGKVRKVLLKGRQQGGSTYVAGRYYKKVTETNGYSAFILSHEAKTTGRLFEMVQRYHKHCNPLIKPRAGRDSAQGMNFPKLDSGFELATAGNKETGRGFTSQLFHGSEVAFWPNADAILAGILQTLPDVPGSEVVLESTANGAGGIFYEYVQDAIAGKGEYELIFVPWYWQPEYRATPPADFKRTEDEEHLVKLCLNHPDGPKYSHKLTDAQLYWRRNKVYELKSRDKFKQEYPCYIKEAFLFSGRPVFDPNHTEEALIECFSPSKVYRVSPNGMTENTMGEFKVWDEPKPGKRYAIGGDVAEGLAHGDYSCLDIVDEKGLQVAQWHGHVEPDLLGDIASFIGRRYNKALIGIERNNHGLTTLTRLKDLGYPNIYVQEELERRYGEKPTKRMGWQTTTRSKPLVIDNLAALLRDGNAGIVCKETVDEMQTYVIDEKGAFNARSGSFDDRVMSYAIAQEMVKHMPKKRFTSMPASALVTADTTAGY